MKKECLALCAVSSAGFRELFWSAKCNLEDLGQKQAAS